MLNTSKEDSQKQSCIIGNDLELKLYKNMRIFLEYLLAETEREIIKQNQKKQSFL